MTKKGKVPIGVRLTAILAFVVIILYGQIILPEENVAMIGFLGITGFLLVMQFFGRTPKLEEVKL